MRNPTKKLIKRKLDKEFSRIIRSKGQCQRCNKTTNLQCAHIFSRKNLSVRWEKLNAICLCAACHFWAHQNPVYFTAFIKGLLTENQYSELLWKANIIKKWGVQELQDLLTSLKEDK